MVENILKSYDIDGQVVSVDESPLAKTIGVKLALGQNLNRVKSLTDAISLYLNAPPSRCYFKNGLVYFEIPKEKRKTICYSTINKGGSEVKLPIGLGIGIDGKHLSFNLIDAPHLLIAGATGSGKSVCLNVIIKNLISNPYTCLVLIDPKQVEFTEYKGRVNHIVDNVDDSLFVLKKLCEEMDERYSEFKSMGVKNHDEYLKVKWSKNQNWRRKIVCIIDELSDLMMTSKKDTEFYICRIAQLARAAGIHLIVATQRPSADIITGIIRSNLPSKIAFRVAKKSDSRIIIDEGGAEVLTGKGDGLYLNPKNNEIIRFQCAFA